MASDESGEASAIAGAVALRAATPDDTVRALWAAPPGVAGGMAAVLASTLAHLLARSWPSARRPRAAAMNQPDGFDCPGCAWPEPRPASARSSSSARTA